MSGGVLEALEEDEAYLAAILQDRSGLDMAEFLWADEDGPDGCFRAWAYQWAWWRDMSPHQIDQCARSVGKSLSIKVRGFAFPFVWPGAEMVVTGPEGIHVDLITDLIETAVLGCRLSNEMLVHGRTGVKHRPFMMNFANGSRIIGRIPQRDGKGVKGIHPVVLELDEAQDYPDRGWTELTETLKRGVEGSMWRAHGVTRGIRDKFYEVTQPSPENQWKVHQYTAMHRPNWTDEERQEKIRQYGSRDDPDYRRNVLGAHGDAANPLFVLHRLMRCVDTDKSSPYNTEEYWRVDLKDTEVEYAGGDILSCLQFPQYHKAKYKTFWIGTDIGFTADPTEILIFAEYHLDARERAANQRAGISVPDEGLSRVKCIGRLTLKRIAGPQQVEIFHQLINHYDPVGFGMDKTGNGLPLYQDLQQRVIADCQELPMSVARNRLQVVKGYGFSEKVLVDFDESVDVADNIETEDRIKEAGIARNVLEFSTDALRGFVDTGRLMLPWDRELIGEFQGQTFVYSKSTMDAYGRRRRIFSEGTFHALDAARMGAMALIQHPIEVLVQTPKDEEPVLDSFMTF